MNSVQRASLIVLLSTPLLWQCMPDFAALSAGGGGMSSDMSGTGGVSPAPGAGSPNQTQGGSGSGSGAGGGQAGAQSSGTGPTPGDGGASGDGGSSASGAAGGAAGAGGEPECAPPGSGVTVYLGFDDGLAGPGFLNPALTAEVTTNLGATASSEWDAQEGASCPGALHFSFAFKEYASGAAANELGIGTLHFEKADWSDSRALHLRAKVSPPGAPLAGVQFFVMSGDDYRYYATFDGAKFKAGDWYDVLVQPVSGAHYDATKVFRLGVQATLLKAEQAEGTPLPPTIDVWLDDVWLEPK